MDASTHAVSPLRQRMIEDMCMRKMQDRTQEAYIRGVRRLARFLGRSPDTATAEDLRRFQLHLVRAGVSPITLNATLTAVRFLFQVTLDRPAGRGEDPAGAGGAAAAGRAQSRGSGAPDRSRPAA